MYNTNVIFVFYTEYYVTSKFEAARGHFTFVINGNNVETLLLALVPA